MLGYFLLDVAKDPLCLLSPALFFASPPISIWWTRSHVLSWFSRAEDTHLPLEQIDQLAGPIGN